MILVDYSQVSLSAILTFKRELRGTESEVKNLIRHVILSSLKSYKKKYGKEYGELVICCDGRKYWRRDVFPHYKAKRKQARENSGLNWTLIFDTLTEIKQEISKHFPYKVIHIDRAEADDVIAVMAKWTQDNQLVSMGLIEEPQRVLILSSDGDFIQLQKWKNITQYSPMQKKHITVNKKELHEKKVTHIVKAGDDGIPNILSKDDVFISGTRQTTVTAKRLQEFLEIGYDACKTDDERRNWHRNVQLIDFDHIPENISSEIIHTYINNKPTGDKMSIMNYLIEKKCRLLLNELEDF